MFARFPILSSQPPPSTLKHQRCLDTVRIHVAALQRGTTRFFREYKICSHYWDEAPPSETSGAFRSLSQVEPRANSSLSEYKSSELKLALPSKRGEVRRHFNSHLEIRVDSSCHVEVSREAGDFGFFGLPNGERGESSSLHYTPWALICAGRR
ncbi:hypothetical protein BDN70DRAFT_894619 [Pholiota conissans]|uniref:Uncharacterized protein n=1 Tax=Pholiota conissans TaxID=109636 RepID=A0A9P6CUS3_9AGAR|nr:hypothetical protein BDN70DRAFT_894619 [Pholiota conissans]